MGLNTLYRSFLQEMDCCVYIVLNDDRFYAVFMCLQANVMLEYPIEEAIELLISNLSSAQTSLSEAMADLDTLKDQITTLEVGMARVYNWDVQERRKKAKT